MQHAGGDGTTGPFVAGGVAGNRFALATALLFAEQTIEDGQGNSDHRGVLGVEAGYHRGVVRMKADQSKDVVGLCPGGDALGGEVGLIRIARREGGQAGQSGAVSGEGCFRGVLRGWRKKRKQGLNQVAVRPGIEIYWLVWRVCIHGQVISGI